MLEGINSATLEGGGFHSSNEALGLYVHQLHDVQYISHNPHNRGCTQFLKSIVKKEENILGVL